MPMLLTETQAAQHAQVDRRTIRKLIRGGRLRAIDLGDNHRHCYRIDLADLAAVSPATDLQPTSEIRVERKLRTRRLPASRSTSTESYLPTV